MNDRDHTRSEVFNDFRNNPAPFLKAAKKKNVPLSEIFRSLSPVAEEGWPEDPVLDMIARSGLRVSGTQNYPSSTVEDFTKTEQEYGHYLLFDYLDRCYENTLLGGVNQRDTRATDPGSGGFDESNFLAGQVYRPYMERPLTQRKPLSPQVRIGDVVSRVETVNEDLVRQPEFITNQDSLAAGTYNQPTENVDSTGRLVFNPNETMINIAPGGKIPTTTIKLGSRSAELKKVGIGLAVTDEFNSNSVRVSALQTWVERVAVNHERAIVNEAVKTIVDGTNAGLNNQDIPIQQSAAFAADLEGIIYVNTYFEEPYMMDLLLCNKETARKWISANVRAGTGNVTTVSNFAPYPQGRFSGIFSGIDLVNSNSQPTRLAYLNGLEAQTGLDTNHLVGIDSRVTLVMYRHARGSVNERERIPSQQLEARYMTERYGFMLEDVNSRFRFLLS